MKKYMLYAMIGYAFSINAMEVPLLTRSSSVESIESNGSNERGRKLNNYGSVKRSLDSVSPISIPQESNFNHDDELSFLVHVKPGNEEAFEDIMQHAMATDSSLQQKHIMPSWINLGTKDAGLENSLTFVCYCKSKESLQELQKLLLMNTNVKMQPIGTLSTIESQTRVNWIRKEYQQLAKKDESQMQVYQSIEGWGTALGRFAGLGLMVFIAWAIPKTDIFFDHTK